MGALTRTVVRLLLSGEVQESPFEGALSRALGTRPATFRRVGPALELRGALLAGETPAGARRKLRAAVERAARTAGQPVSVVGAREEEGEVPDAGFQWLPPSLGAAGSEAATPTAGRDLAPCAACAKEMRAKGRRHGYLRTECAACGPRFSHAVGFPLLRASFGMGPWPPCAACQLEANAPSSRRFGSARVSCIECGPTATLVAPSGPPSLRAALRRTEERINAGEVVAAQTPYGFVALARPDRLGALRVAVRSEFAPVALLVPSAAQASRFAALSARERRALFSPEAPELWLAPLPSRGALARELSVFGRALRVRAPDSPTLLWLAKACGPLVMAPAARGGLELPGALREGGAVPSAHWLTDGAGAIDPVGPARETVVEGARVLLAHGRGSLPADVPVGHGRTGLAFGGGLELFGAACCGGRAYLTGSAGPSDRGASAQRLGRLVSRAAALSPAARADELDFVAVSPEEGRAVHLAGEEAAADAGCPLVEVTPCAARAASQQGAGSRRPRAVLVLSSAEPVAEGNAWFDAALTGGDLVDPSRGRAIGGLSPVEVVEAPGGRDDLIAPLASAFDRAHLPSSSASADDAPLLEVMRARAKTSTSFTLLLDAVAASLGLVPRRAPAGSGVAEVGGLLEDPGISHRFSFAPKVLRKGGRTRLDAPALLAELGLHWRDVHRREGRALPWDRRAALGASFGFALLRGLAAASRAALGSGSTVAVTGNALAEPALLRTLLAQMRLAGLRPTMAPGVPLLDGAVPIGQARLAAALANLA